MEAGENSYNTPMRLRSLLDEIQRSALEAVDPQEAVSRVLNRRKDRLTAADQSYSLSNRRVFLVGAGKAAVPMARAVEEVLGEKLESGLVVVKYGHGGSLQKTVVLEGGHPEPDQTGLESARRLLSFLRENLSEKDLLLVERAKIDQITLEDYSIDERTLQIVQRGDVVLTKEDATWSVREMSASEEANTTEINTFLTAIDDLNIVGVRSKPAGISATLRRAQDGAGISRSDMMSLQSKGYYFTQDGSLVSNEGELQVSTEDGITYTLRCGEILYGTGEAISAGADGSDDESAGPGENRYLFITADFHPERIPEPPQPESTGFLAKEESEWTDEDKTAKAMQDEYTAWQEKIQSGEEEAARLTGRFAEWYYVISAESFDKMDLERGDLVKKKES